MFQKSLDRITTRLVHSLEDDMFSKIVENATNLKNKITQEIGDRLTLSENYGALWEPSENVENCRGCGAKFQLPLLKRKHHCRICAGVFCDSCCMYTPDTNGQSSPTTNNNKPNILSKFGKGRLGENNQVSKFSKSKEIVDENNSNMRTCNGCKCGETPGENLRNVIRSQIESGKERPGTGRKKKEKDKENKNSGMDEAVETLNKFSMNLAVKMGENLVGMQFADTLPSVMVKLIRGSAYGEDNLEVLTSRHLPRIGYFEIRNKSKEFFGIKVLRKGGDQRFEVPRPSYISVPPNGSVHAFFNEKEIDNDAANDLEIIILYNNPNPILNLREINFDTSLNVYTKNLSPCAKIDNFKNVIFYTVSSKNNNVLLKYKGDGVTKARMGNSVQRIGLFHAIQANRHAKDKIDYTSNVNTLSTVFTAFS